MNPKEYVMRYAAAILLALGLLSASAPAADSTGAAFDWNVWRSLPVQDGGRRKPLDTLAWETLRTLSNRASMVDPGSGQKLDAVAFYLTLLFERPGWEKPEPHSMNFRGPHLPKDPDPWDKAPLLRIEHLQLREALGLPEGQKFISPAELSEAKIRDPRTGESRSFLSWAGKLMNEDERKLPTVEQKGVELAVAYWTYCDHRTGKRLFVAPIRENAEENWYSIAALMQAKLDDKTDPTGLLRRAREQFQEAKAAYLAGSVDRFQEASTAFISTLREAGPELGAYPSESTIQLEVAYNHWVPFRFAWVLSAVAFLAAALSLSRKNWLYAAGVAAFVLSLVAMVVGFTMRCMISGRAPVTNMYESVVYLALGTAVFGLLFELLYRRRFILVAAAAVSAVALMLADNCPAVLDAGFRPLAPALRSNFWLVTHVMSITLSYALLALALGLGNITLGYYLFRSKNCEAIASLTEFTYRSLQVGVFLLAVGTVLGGVWADYAWGRFWGWDAKEVWALIALVAYLAILHARHIGWVGNRGLAASSVVGFSLVVMAWYGVNFVLGTGLHSYGFGGGGQYYVLSAVAVQCVYVIIAMACSVPDEPIAESAPTASPRAVRTSFEYRN